MQYRVFMSHSNKDSGFVKYIASQLQPFGYEPIIAQCVRPESFPQYLPAKIKKLIRQSDCVVAFITKNGVTSNWVHQEIGYALDKKPLIPIVEDGIPSEDLGFLQGSEYISLYWDKIEQSIAKLVSWIAYIKGRRIC
jgi:hypothetical protein